MKKYFQNSGSVDLFWTKEILREIYSTVKFSENLKSPRTEVHVREKECARQKLIKKYRAVKIITSNLLNLCQSRRNGWIYAKGENEIGPARGQQYDSR